jgi:ferredoxin
MTYVVTELCVDCKYTDCAAVCPVEAFHELPDRLLINPDSCIDINAEEAAKYPIITEKIPALLGAKCSGPPE